MKEKVEKLANEYDLQVEGAIRVCLKPTPKYIPEKLWFWIASKFIVLEEIMPQIKWK